MNESPALAATQVADANLGYLESLHQQFSSDPASVHPTWALYFESLKSNGIPTEPSGPDAIDSRPVSSAATTTDPFVPGDGSLSLTGEATAKQIAIIRLVNQFRIRGHQQARNNPLQQAPAQAIKDLEPSAWGLTESDMAHPVDPAIFPASPAKAMGDVLEILRSTYCGSIGSEFMHIVDSGIKRWIRDQLESWRGRTTLSSDQRLDVLRHLTAAEGFERYLHRKYVGQKRFSLEGAESLIPALHALIQSAGQSGVREIVIGMAHRGRLNVLVNVLGKTPASLFKEFEGRDGGVPQASTGDVKYHLGFSSDVSTPGGPVHVALAYNPSHLEIIDPVVEGSVRARQDRLGTVGESQVLPLLLHGDAAFAGQGIVMETLNMSETRAFSTGGTVHIVINNQIGFTTSNPFDARSTLYCSDVAYMVQAPVFHVNGDDPEAVLFATELALAYRMKFNRDVVIDLICYRRQGHNEADEPAVTQPLMYAFIRQHPTVRQLYAERLIADGVAKPAQVEELEGTYQAALAEGEPLVRATLSNTSQLKATWSTYFGKTWDQPHDTGVALETLRHLAGRLQSSPDGFELHPRVATIVEQRAAMAEGTQPADWGFAENLAYASLLHEGYHLRLTGQDVGRGTFFHRHAILYNQRDGEPYMPLGNLSANQGMCQVYDSLLSEEGVLGFEYGYSSAAPDTLVVWEAQFGDFANNAQVVIDQFISSGEAKWGRLNGIVMLLPHGYEGQGPEHSSARIERYLQLCAEHNLQVCVPSTPAQIFHLLRRQLVRQYRKPLIVFTPKSLLRHKLAVSALSQLTTGQYAPVLGECDEIDPNQTTRAIVCAGKVYYDLLEGRRRARLGHIAIVRLEQLYPFPYDHLREALAPYKGLRELVWCQEEPANQGAWHQIKHRFAEVLQDPSIAISFVARPISAAPAVGQFNVHLEQQRALVELSLFSDVRQQLAIGQQHAYRRIGT